MFSREGANEINILDDVQLIVDDRHAYTSEVFPVLRK